MRVWRRLLAGGALLALSAPAAAQDCPPIEATLAAVISETLAQRADVTARLSCHFPIGLSFNSTAVTLENEGFDLLNKTERSFHTFRTLGGEEFVSRRLISTGRGQAEFRVTVAMQNRRLVRFSAQYLAAPR